MKKVLISFFAIAIGIQSSLVLASGVNVNQADAQTLDEQLQLVGEELAKRIIEYRERNGNYSSLEDLKKVQGIGDRIIELNRDYISFN